MFDPLPTNVPVGTRMTKTVGVDCEIPVVFTYVWDGVSWKRADREDNFTSTVDGAAGYEAARDA